MNVRSKWMQGGLLLTLMLQLPVAQADSGQLRAAVKPLHQSDAYKIITLEGEDLPKALGIPIEELSLAAMFDGTLEPVPYQIDQYNIGGAVWFPGWDVPMAGDEKRMDATDKLLFLQKDAGERRSGDEIYDGTILAEIRLNAAQKEAGSRDRFVYLVHNSRLRSDEQYVRYSSDIGLVETDFYSLRYNPENHLQWDDFSYYGYLGERPLDALKLSLRGGVLTSITPVELDSNQMVALPTGEIVGPIRTTTQLEFKARLFGVSLLRLSVQIHHVPTGLMYEVRGVIPEFRRSMVLNPSLTMSLDANQLMGASVKTSANPGLEGTVDGHIDDKEATFTGSAMDPESNWIWVSSKRNLDLVSFVDYLGEFESTMSLLYVDDLEAMSALEKFPGQLPNSGYRIEQFPESGFIGLVVSLFMYDGLEGDPATFANQIRALPDLEVRWL